MRRDTLDRFRSGLEERRRARPGRGSALMLFPAAVLIVVMLASLAADSAITFLGQRELANAASAAANDAIGAIDQDIYFGDAGFDLAEPEIARIVRESLDARLDDSVELTSVQIARIGPQRVRITVDGDVSLIFAKAIPGQASRRHVHAVAEASARRRV